MPWPIRLLKHPEIFGNWEIFKKYPFALPNILSCDSVCCGDYDGVFCFLEVGLIGPAGDCAQVVTMADGLQETLESRKHKRDYGLILGRMLTQIMFFEKIEATLSKDTCSGKRTNRSSRLG